MLAQRLAIEFEAVGVVDDTVEDGIGEGWLADHLVPAGDGQLAGDQITQIVTYSWLAPDVGVIKFVQENTVGGLTTITDTTHDTTGNSGRKVIDIIENEGLVENSAKVGRYLFEQLQSTFGEDPRVGEIRGIGIVNVANLYGLTSIRPEKRLDMVVTLMPR